MIGYLPDDFVEDVRQANDIVDIISEYLPLKLKGKNFFGLCPFHNEKTPSFSVDAERQLYHCFGCGEGGNVYNFIMTMENMDFLDSVKYLAEKRGIPLPHTNNKLSAEINERKAKLYSVNKDAALYLFHNLSSKNGAKARDYLYSRGINDNLIKVFGLGFALDAWEDIYTHLLNKGHDKDIIIEAGLAIEKNNNIYDRFRDRLMFPIIDGRNRVTGFGGRVLNDSMPKYMNSPESIIYNKTNLLYGINLVKKRRPIDSIILVEGYMDLISMYINGFYNVLASLGTALTKEQAKLIRRLTGNVTIAFDGDAAGARATLRGLDLLRSAGLKVRVIDFKDGMDPDDTIRKFGKDYFLKLLDDAYSLTEYKLLKLKDNFDLDNQDEKIDFMTQATKLFIEVDNIIERDVYIQNLSREMGFKSELLYSYIKQIEEAEYKNNRNRTLKKRITPNNIEYHREVKSKKELKHEIAEKHLLKLMLDDIDVLIKVQKENINFRFTNAFYSEVYQLLKELVTNNKYTNPSQILNYYDKDSEKDILLEIINSKVEYGDIDRYIKDCIDEIERNKIEKEIKEIEIKLQELDLKDENDTQEYLNLIKKLNEITVIRRTRYV